MTSDARQPASTGGGTGTATAGDPFEYPTLAERDPHFHDAGRQPGRDLAMIVVCFLLAIVGSVGFATVYVINGNNELLGIFLFLAFGGIGAGMATWGSTFMPKGPFQEPRETLHTEPEDKQAFQEAFARGDYYMKRRSFIRRLLMGAMGALGLSAIFPLASLGPKPGRALFHTQWRRGSRMVTTSGRAIKVSDIEVGGFLTVFPEGHISSVDSATVLIHVAKLPITTRPGRETWSPHGYLAFSKICTHAGCPVGLYEHYTQQLLCPCHQSLFDVLEGCKPVFGPAAVSLPQLPISVDAAGYLVARSDYLEPIGPRFWNS
ncbi:MAG: Rieske 2Fe-2S domain-containing protein [Acidimicrobiales bacterium]